ncbi:MAG: outer membrane beta-barrel domain-containing protein [Pseudobdellovibrio sp.]
MQSRVLNLFIALSFSIMISTAAKAAGDVDVPEDELAQETVYPIFDNPVSLKNRNVKDSETIDIGMFGGLALTEPIYNTTKIGFAANYHFSEIHSLGVMYAKNSSGLSRDGQGLKDDFGLDYNRAPKPDYSLMADYNYKLFYGKLSLTKESVMNTSIYGTAAFGTVKYSHKAYPAIALGIGEKFYFTNHLALKLDLRFYAHNAPIPFKANALKDGTGPGGQVDPIPSADSFSERLTYTTNLEIGLNYLF